MSAIQHITRLIATDLDSVIDHAENPETALEQYITGMQYVLVQLNQAKDKAIALCQRIEQQ